MRRRMTSWQRRMTRPDTTWAHRAAYQIHMWTGLTLALYVIVVSVTGSVLVYRNELMVAANPEPVGLWLVSKLLELHDDLLGGDMGRRLNGVVALLVVFLALTGLVVWWPGHGQWRRRLIVRPNVGWRRLTWDLHNAAGFWTWGLVLMFGVSGAYLGNPEPFHDVADRLQPPGSTREGLRLVDHILYWTAYVHFGRINGIGIPCTGPGLCDQVTKFAWALAGLAPALLAVTGTLVWWNRVLRRRVAALVASRSR